MSEQARVIRPMKITPDTLLRTNIEDENYPLWNEESTYETGVWVIDERQTYRAVGQSKGKKPALHPDDWVKGPMVNSWRAFDARVGSQAEQLGGIDMTVYAEGFTDSVALLNVFANEVKVTMTDPVEGVVFEREVSTISDDVENLWQYFFHPIERVVEVVIDDLPPYAGVEIRVELMAAEGDVAKVGEIVMGSKLEIGCLPWGTRAPIFDFSTKEFDPVFGDATIIERDWSKRPEFDLSIETKKVDRIALELIKLRATPCVYIGHKDYQMTIAYGFFKELIPTYSNPTVSNLTLTIEALT